MTQWALVDQNGIVQNIIEYESHQPYGVFTPPQNLVLQQVGDWIVIGQAANTPQPVVSS